MPNTKRRDKDDTSNPDFALPGIGNYIFQKTVGEGNFAKVKLSTHKLTGVEVKWVYTDEKKLGKLYREVRIMKLLHHPNIVKLYEVIETKSTVFLVMEYASGGELYDYLVVHGKMKEKEARAKFRQILSAVSYCHKKHVIHRDLKAENLLLDANLNIKIADFGFSNHFDPEAKLDTFCGSPPYAAPELFQGRKYTGPEVDVWSLGVILYVLTTGCLPFDGKNLQEMRESVCRGKYRIPFYLTDTCEKLLRKFLVREPAKRAGLEILQDDQWINDGYTDSPVSHDISETVTEDAEIIKLVETKFKIDQETVLAAVRDGGYNDIAALYYLFYYDKQANPEKFAAGQADPDILQAAARTRDKSVQPALVIIEEDAILVPKADNGAPQSDGAPVATLAVPQARRRRAATLAPGAAPEKPADPGSKNLKQTPLIVSEEPKQLSHLRSQTAAAAVPVPLVVSSTAAEPPKLLSVVAPIVRKRTNTITGIFKKKTDEEVKAEQTQTEPTDGESGDKPRSLRFTFNSFTTSSKPPDEIIQEVIKICNSRGVSHRLASKYLMECTFNANEQIKEQCKIEVEVCKLPRLNNLHGIRFKRLAGASSDYKDVCEIILTSIKL